MILSYIGNLIFNRKPQKLRQTAVKNPPEQWTRSEGCIEPIIDREVFFSVRKIIEERRVDLSEEEMLSRLRKALLREGRLTPTIIDRTPGLPCSATCQTHFGNFRNLYRLLGYTPKRNYEFLDARPVWSEFRSKLVEQATAAIKAAGGRISSGGWSDCVRVDGMACLSVRAARWTPGQKPTHAPYCSIEREACLPHGWIAAIRLAEHNKTVLDYVLLPTDGKMKRTIRFSEKSRARRGIARFKTVNGLIQAVARRFIKPDPTSHIAQGPRSKRPKAQRSKTKTSASGADSASRICDLALALGLSFDARIWDMPTMSVKSIVAKILRDELASMGIRSLTFQESERVAAHIFERITDLELELAARDLASASRYRD
ncbi:recombinase family protein [Bradyrhizobium sp. BRP20]|uniref:recombinase family protein n=1 Tax=Bradyrhizobium sp. BRP20 TaxID=2793822 RepID=UPI001CD49BB7|nr:recombinase family protein [Bradyrhizobium sp. BRP20]MCA1436175.1 recombinase family protein [Bradyrhizobium sp. BRP20]